MPSSSRSLSPSFLVDSGPRGTPYNGLSWEAPTKISGGSRGEARVARPTPIIFRLNWSPKGRKKKFLTPPPPFLRVCLTGPPPYLKVEIRHWKWLPFSGFTWCHGGHVCVPSQSYRSWTLFICKRFFCYNLRRCWPREWKRPIFKGRDYMKR